VWSAFINVESLAQQRQHRFACPNHQGTLLTVEGYFKPEKWIDKDGVKHNRIVMVANKFLPDTDKVGNSAEPEKKNEKKSRNISCLVPTNKAASVAFVFARMFTCYTSMGCPL
jgi:single-stranded DNA-binding protein